MNESALVLVVDASVARGAGHEKATAVCGVACRRILTEIKGHSHKAFFSTAIRNEWNKHQSNYSRTWRASMMARRRIVMIDPPKFTLFHTLVQDATIDNGKKVAISKDGHLIDAAVFADKRLVTLDKKLKEYIDLVLVANPNILNIIWIYPLEVTFPVVW